MAVSAVAAVAAVAAVVAVVVTTGATAAATEVTVTRVATAATAAAATLAVRANEERPVPDACAGGTTPDAKVCVTVDVQVETAAGGAGGELTRFDVEDALVDTLVPAIAAETDLDPTQDIALLVDTPPEEQMGGVFLTIYLRVPSNATDDAAAALAIAAVRGFGEGLAAGVPKAGAVVVLGPATVVGTRVAEEEGEGGETADASVPAPEEGGNDDEDDDNGDTVGTSVGDGDDSDSDSDQGGDGRSGMSGGAIAGVVFGVLFSAALAMAVVVLMIRRRVRTPS
ncbi:hypothetical protein MMPV_009639 [Pyropia vietnamensis]